jgi:hypothetical protein
MTNFTNNLQVITDILNQLGGRKFTAMTGACNFVAIEYGLQFSFKGSTKANKCRIALEPSDTYKVEFFRLRGGECKPVAEFEGVYNDMLKKIFTSTTGLECTLGTLGG